MSTENNGSHLIARFTRYLCVVAQNARFDKLRELHRYEKHFCSFDSDWDGEVPFEENYASVLPMERDFEFANTLYDDSFGMLGEKSQQVLRYTFIHGLSEDEIAVLLGCKRESVAKLRYRAISRLRVLIERGEIEV